MKKIMFNDRYDLTQAVLEGRKNMTRRICKEQHWSFSDIIAAKNGVFHFEKPKYEIGEVVAIAQPYRKVIACHASRENPFSHDWMRNEKGWNNKMFVRAELMPRKIKITSIKVEHLQDISDEDCLKEGVEKDGTCYWISIDYNRADKEEIVHQLSDHLPNRQGKMEDYFWNSPRKCFANLIDLVCGKGTWESNPWVFAYDFELFTTN